MKNVKKILFAGLTAAALLTAALPAMAEAGANVPAMGQQQAMGGKGGRGMQQPRVSGRGQTNGQANPGVQPFGGKGGRGMQPGQVPQQPDAGSAAQNGTDASGNDASSSATKVLPGFRGFGRGGRHGRVSYDDLLKDGVIDQETYDAIEKYIQDKYTAAPAAESEPAAPAEGELPPELPEGTTAAEDPALLKLVEEGVITQEQYDAILAARAEAQPADEEAPETDEVG